MAARARLGRCVEKARDYDLDNDVIAIAITEIMNYSSLEFNLVLI